MIYFFVRFCDFIISVKNAFSGLFFRKQIGFWNFNFQPRYLGKRSLCPGNQSHFLGNSVKAFYLPSKTNQKKSETRFCRPKSAEDSNAKINVSPNISCTFLIFKASAFFQIFVPKIYFSVKFWELQFFSIVNVWHSFTYSYLYKRMSFKNIK